MIARWAEGVREGAHVVACTRDGFWLRARVAALSTESADVVFAPLGTSDPRAHWLPRLVGLGAERERVPPERVAPLPQHAPRALPPVGTGVIALWDEARFHPGTLLRAESRGAGWVRYDEGDEELVPATRLLPVGTVADGSVARAAGRGLREGVPVSVDRGDGWVSALGSDAVYVRFPEASHGLWYPLAAVRSGGMAKPPRVPRPRGKLAEGARVLARWTDRVWYSGVVVALRDDERDVEVAWDDGARRWVPASRVVVTEEVRPRVVVEAETRVAGVETWGRACSVAVLALLPSGDWARGRAIATRGGDAFVRVDRGGQKLWARGRRLAVPLPPGRLPAPKTAVVVETPAGQSTKRFRYGTGRALRAIGGSLEVKLDGGGSAVARAPAVFVRCAEPPPTPVPAGIAVRTRVVCERRPDDEVRGVVKTLDARAGVARVELDDRTQPSVDVARLRVAPADGARARRVPPPPPVLEPPAHDAAASELLSRVVELWGSDAAGYRDAAGGGAGPRRTLDVEVGELCLAAHVEGSSWVVSITAAGRVEHAPPIDGAAVRLARWLRARLGGRAEDPRSADAEDLAWALALVGGAASVTTARAGGALALTVIASAAPSPREVVSWARAVHARLFGTAD